MVSRARRRSKLPHMTPCPRLTTLPKPNSAKTGWPWTEETPPLPQAMPCGNPWPSISIVTPTFQHGEFLEEAIRSVLLQGYPNLQYLVVDGGSTDNTIDVLRKYDRWIDYWVSEPDSGQTDALNKGFARCSGDVANWLCSDDLLAPAALRAVAWGFADLRDADAVLGRTQHDHIYDPSKNRLEKPIAGRIALLPAWNPISQPSCFFSRKFLDRTPPLDVGLHFCMDLELWTYLKSRKARWKVIDDVVGVYRYTAKNKTMTGGENYLRESEEVYARYVKERIPLTWWYRKLRHPIEKAWMRSSSRLLKYPLLLPELAYVLALGPFYGFRRTALWHWRWIYAAPPAQPPATPDASPDREA